MTRQASVTVSALCAVATVAALSARAAQAQEEAALHRTALSVVGGFSVGSSHSFDFHDGRLGFGDHGGSGFAVGGGVAHDFSPRLTLEASGLWLDRGSSAWSANAGLRLNILPSGRSMVPYFAVSGGLYGENTNEIVANVGTIDDHGQDGRGADGRYPGLRPGPGFRPGPGPSEIVSRSSSSRTDGMMTMGGGVVFSAGEHVFVRPDARAQVVFGDTRVLGLFTLNFGYRF